MNNLQSHTGSRDAIHSRAGSIRPRCTAATSRRGTRYSAPPTRTGTRSRGVAFQFARRLRVFDLDIRRLGTAISAHRTLLLAAATARRAPTVFALELLHPSRGVQDAMRTGPERMGIGADLSREVRPPEPHFDNDFHLQVAHATVSNGQSRK